MKGLPSLYSGIDQAHEQREPRIVLRGRTGLYMKILLEKLFELSQRGGVWKVGLIQEHFRQDLVCQGALARLCRASAENDNDFSHPPTLSRSRCNCQHC